MQKEEKQLDISLELLIARVQDLKNSFASFLIKLENEYEYLNWPSVLDNFALLSGQLNSLGKLMKSDKIPALRNYVLFPLLLSRDRDPELEKLTEGRVLVYNHEIVPDYLRTKPDAEVEDKMMQLSAKAATITPENAQKQLNTMNKITSNILDIINSAREEWENETGQKAAQPQTSSLSETQTLIAASNFGKGLRLRQADTPSPSQQQQQSRSGAQQLQQQQQQQQQQQAQKTQGTSVGKAPSAIKTNIKSASSVHPYQRP